MKNIRLVAMALLLIIPTTSTAYYYDNSSDNSSHHYSLTKDLSVTARAILLDPIKMIEYTYSYPSIHCTYRCITNPTIIVCMAGVYYLYSQFQQKNNDKNAEPEVQVQSNEQDQQ
ncbi:MAG: hypothetical protein Q8Q60_03910 [Candidatus Chromulinivorax sp.]|nr:hypothetical protein [Candidatus Chromulinivorax sp.]